MEKIILIIVLLASYLFNAQNNDKVKIGSSIIGRDDIIIHFLIFPIDNIINIPSHYSITVPI